MIELLSPSKIHSQTYSSPKVDAHVAKFATSRVSPWFSPLAYLLGHHFVLPFFFGRIKVIGQENLPKIGPVILAPTHRARWDALLIPYVAGRCVTGRDLRFMVTITECQGLQGWLVRWMGGFPVDPKRPSIATLRHGVDLLQQGESLVIFPEGGIYRDRQVHPLKPGIARIALAAESSYPELGVQIVPIDINYSQPYPSWGTDVTIHIGQAIKVASYNQSNSKQEAKRLTADLTKALQKLGQQESEIPPHTILDFRF
ncbi:lysophospholipid acyltransferase family protein [Iningainema tapete]|uniref:1-acyl-sn-glycerol-3-phosphate acyltransferase n=1 Tax=Iningainema tapete BLCC-T55 TaxID=2748662 RepID=A0A8J6XPI9_9CYAN|nr:1-acyl-sn-glycerol-3-phosphate acyltransferase [Iningainema tapete]MBD2774951.1 1-acyl-sn-glycerol-3-phosphate acyltransferase [Iningainema tapete BLCC-T55]